MKANLTDIINYTYSDPVEWSLITKREIHTAIKIAATKKTLELDQILNLILKKLKDILTLILTSLFD
jgi:hypothetical protein